MVQDDVTDVENEIENNNIFGDHNNAAGIDIEENSANGGASGLSHEHGANSGANGGSHEHSANNGGASGANTNNTNQDNDTMKHAIDNVDNVIGELRN